MMIIYTMCWIQNFSLKRQLSQSSNLYSPRFWNGVSHLYNHWNFCEIPGRALCWRKSLPSSSLHKPTEDLAVACQSRFPFNRRKKYLGQRNYNFLHIWPQYRFFIHTLFRHCRQLNRITTLRKKINMNFIQVLKAETFVYQNINK